MQGPSLHFPIQISPGQPEKSTRYTWSNEQHPLLLENNFHMPLKIKFINKKLIFSDAMLLLVRGVRSEISIGPLEWHTKG